MGLIQSSKLGHVLDLLFNPKRPKGRGTYFDEEELEEIIRSALPSAVEQASLEAAEGIYTVKEILERISGFDLISHAMLLIQGAKINE